MRFIIVFFNNSCDLTSPDTSFEYDVLHIHIIFLVKFVRIVPWRCGEIMLLLVDVGRIW